MAIFVLQKVDSSCFCFAEGIKNIFFAIISNILFTNMYNYAVRISEFTNLNREKKMFVLIC